MSDFLYSLDVNILRFFNRTLSGSPQDAFFIFITNVRHWYPVYVLLILWLLIKGGKKGRFAALLLLIMAGTTDAFGYRVLKEYFARPRPYESLSGLLLPDGKTGTFSFPSNHALNNFALAVFFSRLYPSVRYYAFAAASLVAISRVYLGLHYPSDIIGGAIIGSGFGYLFALLHNYIMLKTGTPAK